MYYKIETKLPETCDMSRHFFKDQWPALLLYLMADTRPQVLAALAVHHLSMGDVKRKSEVVHVQGSPLHPLH